jgi:hypothetical protein
MLNRYLDELLAQSRQRVMLIEEMSAILSDVQVAEDQFIGRLAGLGRFAQQEQARPLQNAYDPVPHVSYVAQPIAPPPQQPPPSYGGPPPQQAQRPAPQPTQQRQQPPPHTNPVGQHPIPNASTGLRQLLANAEKSINEFTRGAV